MKKKSLLIILAVGVIATGLLTGCGKDNKVAAEVELVTESTEAVEIETETEEVETETETETEKAGPVQTTMFALQTCNVRKEANPDSEVLGQLSVTDPVIVNGELTDGWYNVTYCDQTAYVKEGLLGTEEDALTAKAQSGTKKTSKSSSTTASSSASGTSTVNGAVSTASGSSSQTASNSGTSSTGTTSTPASTPAQETTPASTPSTDAGTTPTPTPEQPSTPTYTPEQQAAAASQDRADQIVEAGPTMPDPF